MMQVYEQDSAVLTRPPAGAGQPAMELRILSGVHQGARLPVDADAALRIGARGDCDVLLGDYGQAAPARLHMQHDGWSVEDEVEATPARHAFGAVALLGQVGVTVCAAHAPWQKFVPPLFTPPAAQPAVPQGNEPHGLPEMPDAPEDAPVDLDVLNADLRSSAPLRPQRSVRPARRGKVAVRAGVALAGLGACWLLWGRLPPPAPTAVLSTTPAKTALSPQAPGDAVKQASLAIALVDPALRMAVTPNAEGGVTVSGWVDSVDQFDNLAQALSKLRPLPRLAVHTASEMLDVLQDAAQGAHLKFTPIGSGKVQATGLVATPAEQSAVLAQLRARAPQGIEIVDGLRVAALQGPAVRRWLEAQGFGVTQVEWDGEQLQLGVEVNAAQRTQLERLLAAAQTPLTGVPFVLQTRMLKEIAAPTLMAAPATPTRVGAGDSGLPFRIRSVVSGPAPYVVLDDGAKLQPGGARAGWQLVAVAQDHVVWNGPKRLEVSR